MLRRVFIELLDLPWWMSVVTAGLFFAVLRWLIPFVSSDHFMARALAQGLAAAAPYVALLFLIPAPFAAYRQWRAHRTFERTKSLPAVRDLPWYEFETLISTAYKRLGYDVRTRGGSQADGGVDLELEEPGKRTLVQCKHWNRQMVGVSVVRELYGVMNAEHAEAGIIVTSGTFSEDAEAFARGKPIELVNGRALEALLAHAHGVGEAQPAAEPECPKCGGAMVLRTAKRGANAGSQFWGCSRYPWCRGTRPL